MDPPATELCDPRTTPPPPPLIELLDTADDLCVEAAWEQEDAGASAAACVAETPPGGAEVKEDVQSPSASIAPALVMAPHQDDALAAEAETTIEALRTAPSPSATGTSAEPPLQRLTVGLLKTYNKINELYYVAKRKASAAEDEGRQKRLQTKPRAGSKGSSSSDERQYDDADQDYVVRKNECWMGRYVIKNIIGKGSFGQVVEARDLVEERDVAIKIIKNQEQFARQARVEIRILQLLNEHDPDASRHIVRLLRHFEFRNHLCLVFEKLHITLYDLLTTRKFAGLPLPLVRKFAEQVLKALDFLAWDETNIMHCDLKPENILLSDASMDQVKVIDFGSSCRVGDRVYPYIQSRYYRSPEVLLGLQYTQAIDMWSLGCIIPELLTGEPLFNGQDEADQLFKITEVAGMPAKSLLDQATKTSRFFIADPVGGGYRKKSDVPRPGYLLPGSRKVDEVLRIEQGGPNKPERPCEPHLKAHYLLLQDLLEKMLVYDPDERLIPREALAHDFFKLPLPPAPAPAPEMVPRASEAPSTSAAGKRKAEGDAAAGAAVVEGQPLARAVPGAAIRRKPQRRGSCRSHAQSPVHRYQRPPSPVRHNLQPHADEDPR